MSTDSPAAGDRIDRALTLLLADGQAAARLAGEALALPGTTAGSHALAHAVCAIYELREGGADAARQHVAQAEVLVDGTADGARAADLLEHVRALGHRLEGRLAEAEALLRALDERAAQRPVVDAYLATAALAIVVSMRSDDVQALGLYYRALALARQSGHDSLLVNALNNLGSYQSDLFNLDDAAPMLRECLAGALRLGSRRQVIYAAGNLVQCLCLMGQAADALAIAREHLIGQIRPDDPPSLHRDEEIAQALLDNGLVDEAAAALGGQAHVDPMSHEMGTVRVWLTARILLTRGRAAEALQQCLARQRALQQEGEEGTIAIDRVNLMRITAQAADQTGDAALAYRLLQQAFVTHERLLGRAARSRQLSLQVVHRLSQAEWERDAAQQMAARLEALNASLQAQIAQTERLQAQLRAQALEDPLTGLYNRRHLMEAGAALLSLQRRRAEPLAVAVVDLDRFKQVNDLHGHEAGDTVLKAFADLARRQTRAADVVCRHGGEEFALLMPGANAAQAGVRLQQLLTLFAALRFDGAGGRSFACTFSAGVAVSTAEHQDLPALLARADAALYDAKQAGRARVLQAAVR